MDSEQQAIELGQEAVLTSLTIAAPFLVVAIVVAILLGILQAMTHVQDQTVSFVPKVLLLAVTAIFCLSWCGENLVEYGRELYKSPKFLHFKKEARETKPSKDMVAVTQSK